MAMNGDETGTMIATGMIMAGDTTNTGMTITGMKGRPRRGSSITTTITGHRRRPWCITMWCSPTTGTGITGNAGGACRNSMR